MDRVFKHWVYVKAITSILLLCPQYADAELFRRGRIRQNRRPPVHTQTQQKQVFQQTPVITQNSRPIIETKPEPPADPFATRYYYATDSETGARVHRKVSYDPEGVKTDEVFRTESAYGWGVP